MQTNFTTEQLADPETQESEKILRTCVHCGFCTATCPTYVLLGDELDSPRGRIYLIKDMLENSKAPTEKVVKHIDRCLSCLSCMTTCPSGVHYMHLIDHARAYIEEHYQRSTQERAVRELLARILPRPWLFRLALTGAVLGKPLAGIVPKVLRPMLAMAPRHVPSSSPVDKPQVIKANGPRRKRVALLNGCAQQVLNTDINEATVRLLTRHGVEVVVARGAGCCGAIVHHMGRREESHRFALANIKAWIRELDGEGLDAIIINASGCGTSVKDYRHVFREDQVWRDKAARIADITRDITEFMAEISLSKPVRDTGQVVAYHSACSMQHGQRIKLPPRTLLARAGFQVWEVPEGHICCGSAGTYNLLQPEIADKLRDRKVHNIELTKPDVIAAGNIGCMIQIGSGTTIPIVHTVELLDWATGGPLPQALKCHTGFAESVAS